MNISNLPKPLIIKIACELKMKDFISMGSACKKFHSIIFDQANSKSIWKPDYIKCLNELRPDIKLLKWLDIAFTFIDTEIAVAEMIDLIKFTKSWKRYLATGIDFQTRNQSLEKSTVKKIIQLFKKEKASNKTSLSVLHWIKKENLLKIKELEADDKPCLMMLHYPEVFYEAIKTNPISNLYYKNIKMTPLSTAILAGNKDVAKFLIETEKVNINACDHVEGMCPLTIAIQKENKDLLEFLFQYEHLDVNIISTRGFCPLMLAILRKNKDIFTVLLGHKDINVNTIARKITCIMLACNLEDKEFFEILLNHKDINLNLQNPAGETVLSIAISKNLTEFAKLPHSVGRLRL